MCLVVGIIRSSKSFKCMVYGRLTCLLIAVMWVGVLFVI